MDRQVLALAKKQLNVIDQFLLACDWTQTGNEWTPPEYLRTLLDEGVELPLTRSNAISIQVSIDESLCSCENHHGG